MSVTYNIHYESKQGIRDMNEWRFKHCGNVHFIQFSCEHACIGQSFGISLYLIYCGFPSMNNTRVFFKPKCVDHPVMGDIFKQGRPVIKISRYQCPLPSTRWPSVRPVSSGVINHKPQNIADDRRRYLCCSFKHTEYGFDCIQYQYWFFGLKVLRWMRYLGNE